jgi:hypothetical protein
MTQALSFSEIVEKALKATKASLKTYVLGGLLLMVISITLRGIGQVMFALLNLPSFQNNIAAVIGIFVVGMCFIIVGAIVQVMQAYFGLVIATDRTIGVKQGLKKTYNNLWKLLLGGMWMALRSFAWVALIGLPFLAFGIESHNVGLTMIGGLIMLAGVVCALYFGPRLAFTNVIQLKDGVGCKKSAVLSIERTTGYWGKIVGNNLLLGLCFMLMSAAAILVLVFLAFVIAGLGHSHAVLALVIGLPVGLAAVVALTIYFFSLQLFAQMYMVELYETITANPRTVKS